jgi:hypothetical protein
MEKRGRDAFALILLALAAAIVTVGALHDPTADAKTRAVRAWGPPGASPARDLRAAARVTPTPEAVPGNRRPNRYAPTRAQLEAFRAASNDHGQTATEFNPLTRYVTGRPRLRTPSTDELIQWVSRKWRIPTNWIRAQLFLESRWRQKQLGDPAMVPPDWYVRYPARARIPGGDRVFQSLGIAQVKWIPDGSVGAGTEPLRWRSTAFNLDYYAATLRYYYDGACDWCSPGYGAGQAWNSIGAWYWPEPWANVRARSYVRRVRHVLEHRAWTRP